MLDLDMLSQLKEVFNRLENDVILRASQSTHEDQVRLVEMLSDLATSSSRIKFVQGDEQATAPRFVVEGRHSKGAITFRGIPGGHEFSSLVLAILNADGKGKQPDSGIVERIGRIRGPVRLKTFVSLSCENCPDVVQALNLMASLHGDFIHETIDGAIAQDEVTALGIQGVPAVIHEGRLLHSGKSSFVELLTKIEDAFGRSSENIEPKSLGQFDVVVIGGGPAGASAAIYSARKGLKTAIVAERFGGQLQETKGIENMISVPYTEGAHLAAALAEHAAKYPISIFEHRRVSEIVAGEAGADKQKRIALESGEYLEAPTIIVATGAKWRQLGIPGEKEHIGQGVAFCAHCDGPFYKGKRVAVVGGGNSGVDAAIDLAGIVESVTLLEFNDHLKADDVLIAKLKALPNAKVIVSAKTTQVLGDGKKVFGLEYENRVNKQIEKIDIDGVFVQIGLLPNSQFVKDLVERTPYGEIVVDARGRTSRAGVYAAGDVTTVPFKQIVIAMGDGAKVALTAFEDRMKSAL